MVEVIQSNGWRPGIGGFDPSGMLSTAPLILGICFGRVKFRTANNFPMCTSKHFYGASILECARDGLTNDVASRFLHVTRHANGLHLNAIPRIELISDLKHRPKLRINTESDTCVRQTPVVAGPVLLSILAKHEFWFFLESHEFW
jgi:hypothetical protein